MRDDRLTIRRIIAFAVTLAGSSLVYGNPVLNNVGAGQVSVQQGAHTTTINQSSSKAILNWQSFNVGSKESVHFKQPAGGVALNRISPTQGASQIYGRLTATGRIILVNPAGVYFGPTAFVNVGSLIATTADIRDQDFLNNRYQFSKPSSYNGAIVNEGQIIARDNGLVALLGQGVLNNGTINAKLGYIALASGSTFTLNFSGDQLINFSVDTQTTQAAKDKDGRVLTDGVSNTGALLADGGVINISAKSASNVLDHVINMEGMLQAQSVQEKNGEIILNGDASAGVVRVAANIDASGKGANQQGGKVTITGDNILLDNNTNIDVSGNAGGGQVFVGGGDQGTGLLPHANAVVMMPNVIINANAILNGQGGHVVLWSDQVTKAYGQINAKGGALSGNGGFVETSGKNFLDVAGMLVNTSATYGARGTWLLDPRDVTITSTTSNGSFSSGIFTPTGDNSTISVQDILNNLANGNVTITTGSTGTQAGNITVNASIIDNTTVNTLLLNAAGTIAINAPISLLNGTLQLSAGSNSSAITAAAAVTVKQFNLLRGFWQQNTANLPTFSASNNFTITSGAQFLRATGGTGAATSPYLISDVYGLQGMASLPLLSSSFALVNNIDASGTATWNSGAGFVSIGSNANLFTGKFNGQNFKINNLFIYRPTTDYVGLFGRISGAATISNVGMVNATITGRDNTGSLIGYSTVGSVLTNLHTEGGVLTGRNFVGGLVGWNVGGTMTNSYNSAAVYGANYVGGVVGDSLGFLTNVYNTGNIYNVSAGGSDFGGVAGYLNTATFTNVYNTGNMILTGAVSNVGGVIGLLGDPSTGALANLVSAYNTGNITVGNSSQMIGGLVGWACFGSTVTSSYAIGTIYLGNASMYVGGLVGDTLKSITNSYSKTNIIASGNASYIGGLAGYSNNGIISNSASYGSINIAGTGTNVGGFVGLIDTSTANNVSNNYSNTFVKVGASSNNVGGFLGNTTAGNGANVANNYSTGAIVAPLSATNVHGFIGINSGSANVVKNNFWDINTSGFSSANAGAVGMTTAQMMQQSNYASAAGWNFSTVWQMVSGETYPFLRVMYDNVRAISGQVAGSAGDTINFSSTNANNINFQDMVYLGANGFYYFLEGNNKISNQNHVLADNTPFLIYSSAGTKLNILSKAPVGGGNVTQLNNLTSNSILLATSLGFSTEDMITLLNGVNSTDILYTTNGQDITLGNGVQLISNADTALTLNGNLNTVSGGVSSLTLNGQTNINAASITTNGAQIYNGAVNVSNNAVLSATTIAFNNGVMGNHGLTLTANDVSIADGLSLSGNASNLIVNGQANINGGSVITGGVQTYNQVVNVLNDAALSGTNLTFNNGINGDHGLMLSANNVAITGGLSLSNLTVNGLSAVNNLVLNTVGSQQFILTGANAGKMVLSGVGSASFSNIQNITGNGASASVVGANTTTSWDITGANAVVLNNSLSFSNIGGLTGGASADSFILENGVVFSGAIDGGAGSNRLVYRYTTPINITLSNVISNGSATGIQGGYSNIQSFAGNGAKTTLYGANVATTWNLTGLDAGVINNMISFSGVGNLVGGNQANYFIVSTAAGLSGMLNGGALTGLNTLDFNQGFNGAVNITLKNNVFSGTAGSLNYMNINNLIGNNATHNVITLLPGEGQQNVVLTGLRSGYIDNALRFANFDFPSQLAPVIAPVINSGTLSPSASVPMTMGDGNRDQVVDVEQTVRYFNQQYDKDAATNVTANNYCAPVATVAASDACLSITFQRD